MSTFEGGVIKGGVVSGEVDASTGTTGVVIGLERGSTRLGVTGTGNETSDIELSEAS
jgi:hypothetical protein